MITMPAPDSVSAPAQVEIGVVTNWFEELRQRVPKR
jgi:hypothetical protein